MTTRTRQRKRLANEGEIGMRNRFASLENEEEKPAEEVMVRKNKREASHRRKELMEIAREHSPRKDDEDV